jgi:protein-S-isoprenylcysteine O-methyltransferase Ste14
MYFLDQHQLSLAPKCLFLGAISAAMIAAWWMMFPLTDSVPEWFEPYLLSGDPIRRGLVLFCLTAYALRVTVTILAFLKRKLIWTEAIIITSLMTFVLLVFAREGGSNPQPISLLEITGLALYVGGSFINTWSEYERYRFKIDPANQGRLYTLGLFRLSRHANYFGDVVLFSGLAVVTGRFGMLVIPLIMAGNFLLILIPLKEAYLAKKYGSQFSDYAKRTRKFVPFIY